MLMRSENHYQTLEVKQTATQQEIKQSYRRLVKKFHPDTLAETVDREKIISINTAYEVLGDPQRRHIYDRELVGDNFTNSRQHRQTEAQRQYQRDRETEKASEIHFYNWLKNIYTPIDRFLGRILNPLNAQIDLLSADPFDDSLMEVFQRYLEDCRYYLKKSKQLFASQPNPAKLAKVAASLYYCLDRVGDGLDELELFTLNYDDRYLHTGQELFRIARQLRREARQANNAVQGVI
jgi:molecular chaperone DnaJ